MGFLAGCNNSTPEGYTDNDGGNCHFDSSVSLTGGVQYTINLAHWSDGTKSLTLTITKIS